LSISGSIDEQPQALWAIEEALAVEAPSPDGSSLEKYVVGASMAGEACFARPLEGSPLPAAPVAASPPPAGQAPYGASSYDGSEFMIGDVWVTVVLLESDGSIDTQTEDWTTAEVDNVKAEVQEGLTWWETTFHSALQEPPLHDLAFHIDFTYADSPVATGYEPITHPSYVDQELWIDSFLDQVGYNTADDYSDDLVRWNHDQRLAHNTHWAYTVFVVDSSADADGKFSDGYFAYAYVGGPFAVMTYDNNGWGIDRMGQVLAHETGHIFYALDEYPGSDSYFEHSGYYNTQNLNASDGNPDPSSRVDSIMAEASRQNAAYAAHTSSPTSLQMIGWQDSDADGIFDVLDVPLEFAGVGAYNTGADQYEFEGTSSAGTLANSNPRGASRDITINTVDRIQYRLDGGAWTDGNAYDGYSVSVAQNVPVTTPGSHTIEFRTIFEETGITSNVVSDTFYADEGDFDYGDAPDGPYPTLSASDGARHQVVSGVSMGADVDAELEAQQDPNALGDDNHGSDDEDGVVFASLLGPGQPARVEVTVSRAGYLNAWVDFNDDGDWADDGEQIFTDEPLSYGSNSLLLTVAADATPTPQTFARFRYTTSDGLALSFDGEAPDGEVEDYAVEITSLPSTDFDFGDAPDSALPAGVFPTLLANNGARHAIVTGGPLMGTAPDADADGQPTSDARGDDDDGNDDEDGVTFSTPLLSPGQTASVDVDMTGSPADGWLSAWIDFNGDGEWWDPTTGQVDSGEHILDDVPVTAGSVHNLTFSVPDVVKPGTSIARFRLGPVGEDLSFDGWATAGEVEDYQVEFPRPVIDVGNHVLLPNTRNQTIEINVSGGHGVSGVVLNVQAADGYPDVPGSSDDGPNITGVDLVGSGTVFGNVPNNGNGFIETYDQIWIVGTTTQEPNVAILEGTLAKVTFDTTPFSSGTWDVKLADTFNGDTHFQSSVFGTLVSPQVINGTIRIDQPPVAIADPGGTPYSVEEGGTVVLDGSTSYDPDPGDSIVAYDWDLDGNGSFETPGMNPTFDASGWDGPATHTVRLRVTDSYGATGEDDAEIQVTNADPVVDAGPDQVADVGQTVSLTPATFTDAGTPDTHTAAIDWGDGTPAEPGTVNEAGGSGTVDGSHAYTGSGTYTVTVTVTDDDGGSHFDTFTVTVVGGTVQVVGRHVFYNNSAWDGDDPGANAADDDAIHSAPPISDPDHPGLELGKQAMLPGQTATFVNYTSYFRGINGIMIDFSDLSEVPTAGDFEFRVGNDDDPTGWADAPEPIEIALREVDLDGDGAPDVDRVTIVWEDYYLPSGSPPYPWVVNPNGIGKQWLQVRALAGNLGLAADDVFYFGNAIGEVGNSTTDTLVNATDEIHARLNPHWFLDPAAIGDPADFNRDQRVDATDQIIARFNQTYFLTDLNLITTPPSAPLPGPAPAPLESAPMPGQEVPAIDPLAAMDTRLTEMLCLAHGPAEGADRSTHTHPVFGQSDALGPPLAPRTEEPFDEGLLPAIALKADLAPDLRLVTAATVRREGSAGFAGGPAHDAVFEQTAARAGRESPDRDLCSRLAWLAAWDAMEAKVNLPDRGKSREAAVDQVLGQFDL